MSDHIAQEAIIKFKKINYKLEKTISTTIDQEHAIYELRNLNIYEIIYLNVNQKWQ